MGSWEGAQLSPNPVERGVFFRLIFYPVQATPGVEMKKLYLIFLPLHLFAFHLLEFEPIRTRRIT